MLAHRFFLRASSFASTRRRGLAAILLATCYSTHPADTRVLNSCALCASRRGCCRTPPEFPRNRCYPCVRALRRSAVRVCGLPGVLFADRAVRLSSRPAACCSCLRFLALRVRRGNSRRAQPRFGQRHFPNKSCPLVIAKVFARSASVVQWSAAVLRMQRSWVRSPAGSFFAARLVFVTEFRGKSGLLVAKPRFEMNFGSASFFLEKSCTCAGVHKPQKNALRGPFFALPESEFEPLSKPGNFPQKSPRQK